MIPWQGMNHTLKILFAALSLAQLVACSEPVITARSDAASDSSAVDARSSDSSAGDATAPVDGSSGDGETTPDTTPDTAPDTAPDTTPDIGSCACSAGSAETSACGACGTGTQTRLCGGDCAWEAYGACEGEELGFPVDVSSGAPLCPPYDRPAVFFSPHPDDETIGYAANIFEHVQGGRDVFVELMTHGRSTGVRAVLADGRRDPWHLGSHDHTLTPDQIGDARIAEFRQAVAVLGVTGIHISDFGDGNVTRAEVNERISWWLAHNSGGLSLKGTVGAEDPRAAGGTAHPDHQAVWDALTASGFADLRGWLVYHHTSGVGTFTRQNGFTGQPACDAKRAAVAAYGLWDPAAGRYAIGYHSVPTLLDSAGASCIEYTVVP
jgi:LmbE family N-acetylglucosaminyl deacetylase